MTIETLASLGGLAGLAAIITALATIRGAGKRAAADATQAAGETIATLHQTITTTIERLEEETGELRDQVQRLENDLADARRGVLEMTDALAELSARIDAALAVLDGTRDPAGEAARNILTKPRRRRKAAQNDL